MIRGLDFVALPTQDMPRAIPFYRDVLGLKLLGGFRGKDGEPSDRWVEFELPDGNTLAILDLPKMGMPFAPVMSVCLGSDDVDATVKDLAAKGVTFPQGAEAHDSGVCKAAMFQDPDGNTIYLHHRYAPEA